MGQSAFGRAQARTASAAEEASLAADLFARWIDDPEVEWKAKKLSRPLRDVRADVARFVAQLELARSAGKAMPCLSGTPSQVPVPIVLVPSVPESVSPVAFVRRQGEQWVSWYKGVSIDPKVLGAKVELHDGETAKGFLNALLRTFLGKRFSTPSVPIGTPGLPVRVETRTKGARVHFSTVFVQVYDRVFGEPTSPVDGFMEPGNYRFGLSKAGHWPKFDYRVVEVPPEHIVRLHL